MMDISAQIVVFEASVLAADFPLLNLKLSGKLARPQSTLNTMVIRGCYWWRSFGIVKF